MGVADRLFAAEKKFETRLLVLRQSLGSCWFIVPDAALRGSSRNPSKNIALDLLASEGRKHVVDTCGLLLLPIQK